MHKLNDVILARCFAVFSLVVWHTACIYIGWGDRVSCPLDSLYQDIFGRLIPLANMPLFTFLAGYLFRYQIIGQKYSSGKLFIKSKIRRLLIPYFLLGTAVVFLQYGCIGQFKEVLYGAPNHLWFCLMLFYCYMVCWFFESKSLQWVNIILAALSLGIISRFNDWGVLYHAYHIPLGIEIAAYFFFFFFLGYICFDARKGLFGNWKAILVYMLIYVVVKDRIIRVVDYIFLIMTISSVLSPMLFKNNMLWAGVEKIAKCSFGIYVLHHTVLWNLVSYPSVSIITIPILEKHYIISPILLCIVVFVLCLFLTDVLLRSKTGRFLLG